MNAIKFQPKPAEHKPPLPLTSREARAEWDTMVDYYDDWPPDALVMLVGMCNDAGIIAACDRDLQSPDLTRLELASVDLRRDRAIKRYWGARQRLNLDVPPQESRPPRSATRYAGRA
jgi:hypothetical protein